MNDIYVFQLVNSLKSDDCVVMKDCTLMMSFDLTVLQFLLGLYNLDWISIVHQCCK
jgi:hypothetical protein